MSIILAWGRAGCKKIFHRTARRIHPHSRNHPHNLLRRHRFQFPGRTPVPGHGDEHHPEYFFHLLVLPERLDRCIHIRFHCPLDKLRQEHEERQEQDRRPDEGKGHLRCPQGKSRPGRQAHRPALGPSRPRRTRSNAASRRSSTALHRSARRDRRYQACSASRTRPRASPPGLQRGQGGGFPTGMMRRIRGRWARTRTPPSSSPVPEYAHRLLHLILEHWHPPRPDLKDRAGVSAMCGRKIPDPAHLRELAPAHCEEICTVWMPGALGIHPASVNVAIRYFLCLILLGHIRIAI